jgi:thiol:disulfide interchange protein DsbD
LPWLGLAAVLLGACGSGGEDSFTYWLGRYGVAGGCLGSYLGGLLVSLTPCVYPMIVITVSIFGANPEQSWARRITRSLAFVGGMCAMYTPLGVAAGLTGSLFGAALASPWVVGFIVVVLLALAASMYGMWEMTLPASWQTKLNTVGGVGFLGAFLMGLVAGILAAPCSGPVTIALLTHVGTTADPIMGALFFFCYALGIGTLFFFVGTFALSLPGTGRWTEWVKGVFGLLILVMAGYYLRLVVPGVGDVPWRSPVLVVAAAVALAAGIALGAVHLSTAGERWGTKLRKVVAVVLATAGATALVLALVTEVEPIPWRDDYVAADAEARRTARPMIIDFTATWCGACQELAHETFTDPAVVAEAERFVPVRVDATQEDEASERFMRRYEVRGLPTVLVISSVGEESARVTEFVPPDRMLALLRAAR